MAVKIHESDGRTMRTATEKLFLGETSLLGENDQFVLPVTGRVLYSK